MRDLLSLAGPGDLVEIDYDDAVGAINVRGWRGSQDP